MRLNNIEPFLILPIESEQDILFWANTEIKENLVQLIDYVYCDLPNTVIKDNLIKVFWGFNYIIVFHLYPTNIREKYSERLGQNLIIGYIVKKEILLFKTDLLVQTINMFFDAIKFLGKNIEKEHDIPSKFLLYVNEQTEYASIYSYLDAIREKMVGMVSGKYYCLIKSYYSQKKKYSIKNKMYINCSVYDRLAYIYNFIRKFSWKLNKDIWIMVNCCDIKYYSLKNIQAFIFSDK